MICKPGNLLGVREELPSKAEHSTAVVSTVVICEGEADANHYEWNVVSRQ